MPIEPQIPEVVAVSPPRRNWYRRVGVMLFIIFCFEIGVFLLIFPWLDPWDNNWVADMHWLTDVWDSTYLRGALSGLGLLNIYISFLEVFRMRRAVG